MLGPLRTLISLAFVGGALWAAFAVPLGGRTLAEHVDRIGQTPEAQELVEGTRETVNPLLDEAASRVLGERVEAPTYLPPAEVDADADGPEPPPGGPAPAPSAGGSAPHGPDAAPRAPASPDHARLPGRG